MDVHSYRYPENSGCHIIQLEALVFGKGRWPATFILGRNPEGRKLRFRWYRGKEFVGISPENEAYAYQDSQWLMGNIISKDGCAELVAAIPLECLDADIVAQKQTEQSGRNLEDILADAMEAAGMC